MAGMHIRLGVDYYGFLSPPSTTKEDIVLDEGRTEDVEKPTIGSDAIGQGKPAVSITGVSPIRAVINVIGKVCGTKGELHYCR